MSNCDGSPAPRYRWLTSGSVAGSASKSALDIGIGVGALESTPSASATALLDKSISERCPSQITYVAPWQRPRIALGIAAAPNAARPQRPGDRGHDRGVTGRDVAVAAGAVSHTAHCEAVPVRIGMAAGAPDDTDGGPLRVLRQFGRP